MVTDGTAQAAEDAAPATRLPVPVRARQQPLAVVSNTGFFMRRMPVWTLSIPLVLMVVLLVFAGDRILARPPNRTAATPTPAPRRTVRALHPQPAPVAPYGIRVPGATVTLSAIPRRGYAPGSVVYVYTIRYTIRDQTHYESAYLVDVATTRAHAWDDNGTIFHAQQKRLIGGTVRYSAPRLAWWVQEVGAGLCRISAGTALVRDRRARALAVVAVAARCPHSEARALLDAILAGATGPAPRLVHVCIQAHDAPGGVACRADGALVTDLTQARLVYSSAGHGFSAETTTIAVGQILGEGRSIDLPLGTASDTGNRGQSLSSGVLSRVFDAAGVEAQAGTTYRLTVSDGTTVLGSTTFTYQPTSTSR